MRFLHKERKINTTSNLYMEMRKTVLYGVLAFCLVVLNSCLGDPATQLTMANQAGVVVTGYGPGKAIYTKGDVVVSSEDFQNANVENGECILFDYSIDYGVANNMGAGTDTSYTEAIIYENTISEVNRWNFYNTLTDTSIVAKDELLLSSLQARSAYIRGNLFLFTEISNHPANQVDSFLRYKRSACPCLRTRRPDRSRYSDIPRRSPASRGSGSSFPVSSVSPVLPGIRRPTKRQSGSA